MKKSTTKLKFSAHTVTRLQGPKPLAEDGLKRVAGGSVSYGGYCYGGDWYTYGCGSGGGNDGGGGDY